MDILIVANTYNRIFEIDSGAALRNNLFVKAFSEVGHVDIICFSYDNLVSNIPNCDVLFSHNMWDNKDFIETIRTLICMTIRPTNPYSYYKLNKYKAAVVDNFIKEKEYDIIACRYVETAVICGLLRYKDKLVIDADDNLANVLKFQAVQASSIVKKRKKQYESKRIGGMLKKLLGGIRCSFCSNPLEIPSPRTIFLHNTTVLKQPVPELTKDASPRILYIGYLRYFPNKQGIMHFVESIFPRIKESVPLAELQIVGDGEPEFLSYLNGCEGVKAVGRVNDLVLEYQQASVVAIPIYYGSGTCVKFVEAMLMNRPVVSSPVGARGFSDVCKDREDYMLANNDNEFANKTVELLSSVSKSKDMAEKAYEIAKKNYSQEKFIEIVRNAIIKE